MTNQSKYILSIVFVLLIIILAGIFFTAYNLKRYNAIVSNQVDVYSTQEADGLLGPVVNFYNQGKFAELNKELDSKIADNPNDFALLFQKAQALAQEASLTFKEKELGDQAMIYVDKALKINSDSVEALTLKGYIFEIQENYTNAHKYYDQALKLEKANVSTLAQKGHAYDLEGKLEEAEKYYQQAYKLDSKNLIAMSGLVRIKMFNGDTEGAIELLKGIVANAQNARVKAEALNNLGLLFETESYSAASEKYFSDAITVDATLFQPYVGLAKEEFKKAMLSKTEEGASILIDDSFKNLEKALQVYPDSVYARIQLAIQLIVTGDKDMAKKIIVAIPEKIEKDISLNKISKDASVDVYKSLLEQVK